MAQLPEIERFLESILDESYFVVEAKFNATQDKYNVFVDSYNGITLEKCKEIHRKLNEFLLEKDDDFSLEVSSPGLTSELRVWQQYKKLIGSEIQIITTDNKNVSGEVLSADNQAVVVKISNEQTETYTYQKIKKAKTIIKF